MREKHQRSSRTVMKVLSPASGFPSRGSSKWTSNPQGIWAWSPAGLDCRISTGLGKTETPFLQDTGKAWCAPGTRGKEQWPHRRLSQTYLWVLEALLRRWGLAVACHGNRDTGSSSPGRRPLAWALLEIAVSPTIEPVDSRAESPQAKQLTWTEPSPSADNWI